MDSYWIESTPMNQVPFLYIFYLFLIALVGVTEYFKLVPSGTTAVVLGGIFGHGLAAVPQLSPPTILKKEEVTP